MAVKKVIESTDTYSFETQIPKMFDVFVQKGVVTTEYSQKCQRILTKIIDEMQSNYNKLGDYLTSTESINTIRKYINTIEDTYDILNIYFYRLKILYKRVVNLDEGNPNARFDQKINDTTEDLKEAVKELADTFYSLN